MLNWRYPYHRKLEKMNKKISLLTLVLLSAALLYNSASASTDKIEEQKGNIQNVRGTSTVGDFNAIIGSTPIHYNATTGNLTIGDWTHSTQEFEGLALRNLLDSHFKPGSETRKELKHIQFLTQSNSRIKATGSFQGIFQGFSEVTAIDGLEKVDTSNITSMSNLFSGMSNLKSVDISAMDTSSVSGMAYMFQNTSQLETLDFSSFDTSNVKAIFGMFQGASSIKSLDLSSFNTSKITSFLDMFSGMTQLHSLNLSSFTSENISSPMRMLYKTKNLRVLTLSSKLKLSGSSLPDILPTPEFTGKWQNVGEGTIENPKGDLIFTSMELMQYYAGDKIQETFVWQKRDLK